ncbi:MAG: hypothetical protein WC997_07880 [Porticoccaceae bacterium]
MNILSPLAANLMTWASGREQNPAIGPLQELACKRLFDGGRLQAGSYRACPTTR